MANSLNDEKRTLDTGLPPDQLNPDLVWYRTQVLLAQAETLGRLLRTADRERKLLWTFAVAYDCFTLRPDSPLAALTAARVARIAGQFDLAAKMLRIAQKLNSNDNINAAIALQESLLERERDIDATGLREAMIKRLFVYACHRCGRLVEHISIPCMFCGWQPLTIQEVSQAGRLSTVTFNLWELLGIGREIARGRKATEVVSNLTQSAEASMADPQYRGYVEQVVETAKFRRGDRFFYYLHVAGCHKCGAKNSRHNPFVTNCFRCDEKLRIPPPLRLLSCLGRASVHFQNNFDGDKSEGFDLFIRYLVSLQDKLFQKQETPSPDERNRVLQLMGRLAQFRVTSNFGVINMSDPKSIVFHQSDSVSDGNKARARALLEDFTRTLQFLADWMFKTKALC